MINLHPPLVAFPVALLSVVVFLEVMAAWRPFSWIRSVISVNLVLAAAAVLVAFFSGYQASELADQTFQVPDDQISWHHAIGRMLLFVIWPCLALGLLYPRARYNRSVLRAGYLFLLLCCFALVLYTGFLGGELVFKFGAGVSASQF